MEKRKFASISLTVRDRAILSQFLTHRVSQKCTMAIFQKNLLSPKMAAILNFEFLPKIEKRKFVSISLTVRDRVISSKFLTHRVSQQTTLQFSKIVITLKMAAILNFPIFTKNGKTQICFYLPNCARWSDFAEIFDPQGI